VADKNRETIQKWAADMMSLETHIEEAIDGQLDKFKDHPQAAMAINRWHAMIKAQREAMKHHVDQIGGETSGGLKGAVTSVLGKTAGLIDQARSEGLSKSLRDDYTAFNLAAIGYHMLRTTALALGDSSTAQIAERHLRSYARAVQEINQLIGDVVVWELRKDQLQLANPTAATATDDLNTIWRDTGPHAQARTV